MAISLYFIFIFPWKMGYRKVETRDGSGCSRGREPRAGLIF